MGDHVIILFYIIIPPRDSAAIYGNGLEVIFNRLKMIA